MPADWTSTRTLERRTRSRAFSSLVIALLALGGASSSLAVQVAFFEAPTALEPEGRFNHVALSYRGKWIHAHPIWGVQIFDSLVAVGRVTEIWENQGLREPSAKWVRRELSKHYDPHFHWESRTGTYCSKLVGTFLKIPPTPMGFTSEFWQSPHRPTWARHVVRPGDPGLSPDEIAQWIRVQAQHQGWRSLSPTRKFCETSLSSPARAE